MSVVKTFGENKKVKSGGRGELYRLQSCDMIGFCNSFFFARILLLSNRMFIFLVHIFGSIS